MCDRISEFYNGKSIFLTGAPGFLGSVLMEVLLRCFPGIAQIYILVRPKKGFEPDERKNIIFQKKIFSKLLKEHPEAVDKVKVISGDVTLPDLGISKEDLLKITQDVSIVFHCAATVSFGKSLSFSVSTNTLGTVKVAELCRKLKACEAFVYSSTCYSNTHLSSETIEEKIYTLPFTAEKFLEEFQYGDVEPLLETLSKHNYKWPNTYTFSKSLAENILAEKAHDLPIAIVRPSIIYSTAGGPVPGYNEPGLATIFLTDLVARGVLQVFPGKGDALLDVVPCDVVANVHLTAAWYMAKKRCTSPFIVNCSSGTIWKHTVRSVFDNMENLGKRQILPNASQEASTMLIKSRFLYELLNFYKHVVPAFVMDIGRRLKGQNPKWISIRRKINSHISTLKYFFLEDLSFKSVNVEKLSQLLHPEDRQKVYMDLNNYAFEDTVNNVVTGSTIYDWKKDKLSRKERKNCILVNTMMATFIRRSVLFLFVGIMYAIVKNIFF